MSEQWVESADPRRPARERLRHLIRRTPGAQEAARSLRQISPQRALERVRETSIFALQCAIAAGIALLVAEQVFNHQAAFFAPIAAIISLGLSEGKRLRRGFELVLGAAVGIGIGDAVISVTGTGYWQVSLAVLAAILSATFIDRSVVVPMQAATTAVVVATIIPPGTSGAMDRMVDALIGGVIGLLVLAIVPNSPLRTARREMSRLIAKTSLVLDDVAAGMEARDGDAIYEALETARGTQTLVNAMLQSVDGGSEMVSVSPMYWSARRHSRSMRRVLVPADNLMRNARVLARRAEIMIEDEVQSTEELIDLIRGLSDELGRLAGLFATGGTRGTREEAIKIPSIVRSLQRLAARTGMEAAEGTGLSGSVVLAQVRSMIVDALQVCGYSRKSAMAALAPTVERPWFAPEIWDGDDQPSGGNRRDRGDGDDQRRDDSDNR
ncbi:FUSC family protein [Corynebacterium auriscanis]|uniref:FUSC family protein n=1 Tax=Corynebacterium auriscanis TaxID=99807 RepID=UPI002245EC2F|nr:FUSC family protein [Corynebacterium auriscanis]MCX2163827.1 FUSC family protein [Corynebacterium auriscanis]